MNIILKKKVKDNSAIGTTMIILGVILCFVPFSSWIHDIEIEVLGTIIVVVLMLLGFILIRVGIIIPGEKRPRKKYVTNNGEFDLIASRKYEPYPVNRYLSLLGGFFLRGRYIKSFEYATGVIKIVTNNGKSMVAPLGELSVLLVDDKFGMDGAAITLKYKDQKVKICHNDILFEDWEIEDMNRILSYAGEVKAGLATKLKIPSNFSKNAAPAMMRSNAVGLDVLASNVRMKFQKPIADKDNGTEVGEIPKDFKIWTDKYIIDSRTVDEKQADTEINKMIEDIKSDTIQNISISEIALTDWIKNASAKGFEKLFETYDIIVGNDLGCPKRQTLKQSAILKKIRPFYEGYKYLDILDTEYMWLSICCGILVCGLSVIGLSFLKDVSGWYYVIGGVGIVIGILIAIFLPYGLYSDKIEKIQKIFLNSREEVIKSGNMNNATIEMIRGRVKSAERSYRLFNYFDWILGIGFIAFLLWRSYR